MCICGGALGSRPRRRRLPIPLAAAGWPTVFSRSLFPPGRFASGARISELVDPTCGALDHLIFVLPVDVAELRS